MKATSTNPNQIHPMDTPPSLPALIEVNNEIRPIDIVFKDITYSVEVPSEDEKFYHKIFCCFKPPPVTKEILKGVTGII